jgi:hypothetical protein
VVFHTIATLLPWTSDLGLSRSIAQVGLPWPLPLLRPLTTPLHEALPEPLIPRPDVCSAAEGQPNLPVDDHHWTPLLHAEVHVETMEEKVVDEPVLTAIMRGRGRWRLERSTFMRRVQVSTSQPNLHRTLTVASSIVFSREPRGPNRLLARHSKWASHSPC